MQNRTIIGDGYACYALNESIDNITLFEERNNPDLSVIEENDETRNFIDWSMSFQSVINSTVKPAELDLPKPKK